MNKYEMNNKGSIKGDIYNIKSWNIINDKNEYKKN